MRDSTVARYAFMADRGDGDRDQMARERARERARSARDWTQGGGELAGIAAYRAHHPKARLTFVNGRDGRRRWLTAPQARVWAIIHRDMRTMGGRTRITDIAAEAGITVSWASRTVQMFHQWRWITAQIKRGRNGGVRLFRHLQERATNLLRKSFRQLLPIGGNIYEAKPEKAPDPPYRRHLPDVGIRNGWVTDGLR